ncbi:endonuclease/exonuclease/phosphatase family protein [Actinomycetospora succinea]|uniref:endonuclease/exonuclease/phosphatase family protein n=1 Tax=Actinomycetospora succinea TaxID=663603 RepID=UPI001FB58DC1|nr:endonuclease/exonuclease/phosphatase family protein [Actinomycetospora succinea]
MTTLRVATWNLWWRFGDPDRRRPAIAAELRDTDADLVGLQEVWSRGDRHLAAELADELGRHVAFVAVPDPSFWTDRLGDDSFGLGNAVLSRWPLRDVRAEVLPTGGGPEAQILLSVVADTPAGSLRLVTTHLTPALTDSARRVAQVRALARHVVDAEPTDLPPVVTGDFNAEPDSDEMRLLEGHLTAPAEPGLLLADAWRWATPPARDDGATWRSDNPYVAARGDPPSRVDRVLLGLGRGRVPVGVESVGLLGTRGRPGPDGEVWPSDHAGVVVDLRAGT